MQRILFVQLPTPRFLFPERPVNIPLAAGFLASAMTTLQPWSWRPEVLSPDAADCLADAGLARTIVESGPAAVGLTLYLWNVQRSLFLASNIKRLAPETRILVGGPEVTPDNEWVLHHPAVDAGLFGEGESRICALVEAMSGHGEIRRIPGSFFKDATGLHLNLARPAAWDLSAAPYPYLAGTLPVGGGVLFLETMRGCPFRCRYCYYHKAFDGVRIHPEGAVEDVLDIAYSEESQVTEIYLMDPTFNIRPDFRKLLQMMARKRAAKDIALHAELRADLLSEKDVDLLKRAGMKTAEVGLQTIGKKALAAAGRFGEPEAVARGVHLLKSAGIEVTTGIILGLPEDTPEGFSRTLEWLKSREAYSVVHPFVLSVLPGSEFRHRAEDFGLDYDRRPPYYVRSTRAFTPSDLADALVECERVFQMELDAIPFPSLVDRGPCVISHPEGVPYVSKWIIGPRVSQEWRSLLDRVIEKASDPFTLWLLHPSARDALIEILRRFTLKNPHAVLSVVFDFGKPPEVDLLEAILDAAAEPNLFANRALAPLCPEDTVVTPDFTVILPDPGDPVRREEISDPVIHLARPVWELTEMTTVGGIPLPDPLLLAILDQEEATLFRTLESFSTPDPPTVLFREQRLQEAWNRRRGRFTSVDYYPERILVSGGPVGGG